MIRNKLLTLSLFLTSAAIAFSADAESVQETASLNLNRVEGRFEASDKSLSQYQTPDWFRDTKFGIWAHWGPQAVPRQGDWYARQMYVPGTAQYEYHAKHYGHPSKFGYKDIIPLWQAERFDPYALMDLYSKAGAKYFVSMAVHHDNFDLWHSKFHSWNAYDRGPHRDIVLAWQRAAQKYGLRFGVSEHLGASYSWFDPSHGYDQFWPRQGVGYDGENPEFNELYHTGSDKPYRGPETWYTNYGPSQQNWFNRISDLIDQFQPDLLYTDGGIPFGAVGKTLVSNFYNSNIKQHDDKLEAVYTHKNNGTGEFLENAAVQDVERGVIGGINPHPWQTDTSIGDWFYNDNYAYKTTAQVVHMLADIVSKNGNLLLNVVQYPNGSLPPESTTFLQEMAAWMAVNSEAIFSTRPWHIFGEGPTQPTTGHFNEDDHYTANDIRFTQKDGVLYAITLSPPSDQVNIKSLGLNSSLSTQKVKSVQLLGYPKSLEFKQTNEALTIDLPKKLPSLYSSSFKVEFESKSINEK